MSGTTRFSDRDFSSAFPFRSAVSMTLRAALLPGVLSAVQGTNPAFLESDLDVDHLDFGRELRVQEGSMTTKATQDFYKFHSVLSKVSRAGSGVEACAAVEEAAELVVQSGVKIDQITKATLQTLRKTLVDTTEGMILQAHGNDQKLLDDHTVFVNDCINAEAKGLEGDAFVQNMTNHARQVHRDCQKDLNDMEGYVNHTCKGMEDFRENLRPPLCEIPTGDQWRDIMDEFFVGLDTWVTGKEMAWDLLEQECTGNGHDGRTDTENECKRYQREFEQHFCTFRLSVINTCYEYKECFDRSIKEFDLVEESVKKNEHGRKVDWRATGKLECYIDVILSEAASTERDEMIKNCKTVDRDTGRLDISYPPFPDQATCDMSVIHPHPCSQEFMMSEYAGMLNTECTPCTELPPYLQEFEDLMLGGGAEHSVVDE